MEQTYAEEPYREGDDDAGPGNTHHETCHGNALPSTKIDQRRKNRVVPKFIRQGPERPVRSQPDIQEPDFVEEQRSDAGSRNPFVGRIRLHRRICRQRKPLTHRIEDEGEENCRQSDRPQAGEACNEIIDDVPASARRRKRDHEPGQYEKHGDAQAAIGAEEREFVVRKVASVEEIDHQRGNVSEQIQIDRQTWLQHVRRLEERYLVFHVLPYWTLWLRIAVGPRFSTIAVLANEWRQLHLQQ